MAPMLSTPDVDHCAHPADTVAGVGAGRHRRRAAPDSPRSAGTPRPPGATPCPRSRWCPTASTPAFGRWVPAARSLVWFGRITAEKAPHLAIAAARRAGLPLVLAGPVSDREYFERFIVPRLGDEVRYAGHLRHGRAGQSGRPVGGRTGHADVGRAVRARRRRGDVLRHARRGVRPRRHSRNRCATRRATRRAGRRRGDGRRHTGRPSALSRRDVHEHALARCSARRDGRRLI